MNILSFCSRCRCFVPRQTLQVDKDLLKLFESRVKSQKKNSTIKYGANGQESRVNSTNYDFCFQILNGEHPVDPWLVLSLVCYVCLVCTVQAAKAIGYSNLPSHS